MLQLQLRQETKGAEEIRKTVRDNNRFFIKAAQRRAAFYLKVDPQIEKFTAPSLPFQLLLWL